MTGKVFSEERVREGQIYPPMPHGLNSKERADWRRKRGDKAREMYALGVPFSTIAKELGVWVNSVENHVYPKREPPIVIGVYRKGMIVPDLEHLRESVAEQRASGRLQMSQMDMEIIVDVYRKSLCGDINYMTLQDICDYIGISIKIAESRLGAIKSKIIGVPISSLTKNKKGVSRD